MDGTANLASLARQLQALESETFEVKEYAGDTDMLLALDSTSTSSTSSTTSTCSCCG